MRFALLNKNRRALLAAILAAAMLICATALAANDLSATADKTDVAAGDTVEVVLTLKGEALSAAEGSFTYDAGLLSFEEGEGGAGDGYISLISMEKGGSGSLSARIKFKALAEGKAEISFTISRIMNYKGDDIGKAETKLSLNIAKGPEPTPTPEPISYAKEGVKAVNVEGATTDMYVWRSIENVTIPSRYSESTYQYHNETVAAAIVNDSDAPLLLYVTDDTGATGGYHIYDEAQDKLYPYMTVSSTSKSYIILEPAANVKAPEGFSETTLTIDEREYRAWRSDDAQPIYLLYARNPAGEVGFYAYSVEDASMQRYSVLPAPPIAPELPDTVTETPAPAEPEATPSPVEKADGGISSVVFYIVVAVAVLLLAALLFIIISHKREEKLRRQRAAKRRAEREKAMKQQDV